MLYLKKKDAKILLDVKKVFFDLYNEGKLSNGQTLIVNEFYALITDSERYTKDCRDKAKKFVQEKRKTDKTYAHKLKR